MNALDLKERVVRTSRRPARGHFSRHEDSFEKNLQRAQESRTRASRFAAVTSTRRSGSCISRICSAHAQPRQHREHPARSGTMSRR